MKALIVMISIFALILAGCSAPAQQPAAQQPAQQPASTSPKISVSPQSISAEFIEGETKTVIKTLNILNDGGGVMIWAATKSQPWIWMTDANGALEKGYSKKLDINIAAPGLKAGTYKDNINIEGVGASNSPVQVPVTIVVKAPPEPKSDSGTGQVRNPAPPPPWDYDEWTNDTYNLRLRYPKDYITKTVPGMQFGAVSGSGQDKSDMIMAVIQSSYGVAYLDAITEFSKEAMRQAGASRLNPRVILNDNTTMLADGVTPAYEVIVESRSASSGSFECYVFGFKLGNRYVFFAGVSLLAYAPEREETWKQIGKTMEITE